VRLAVPGSSASLPAQGRITRLLAPAALVVLLAGGRVARAEPSSIDVDAACTASYTSAQRLRMRSQLRSARKQLLACLHPSCSPVLRRDCATWLDEVESLAPSIVIAARDPSGHPTRSVRVSIDGEVVAEAIQDVPLGVDPGVHTLRFEMAGASPVDKPYVIHEGEKAVPIEVVFVAAEPPHPPPHPPPPPVQPKASVPPLTYALGIGGAVALATGVTFEVLGLSERFDLDSCRGHCAPSQVDGARANVAVGDVASVVALAALGGAAYLAFVRPRFAATPTTGSVRVEVTPFAGGLAVDGAF
jgi:hypothetical protein